MEKYNNIMKNSPERFIMRGEQAEESSNLKIGQIEII